MSPELKLALDNARALIRTAQEHLDAHGLGWSSTKLDEALDTLELEAAEMFSSASD